jgi:hypothetical protein
MWVGYGEVGRLKLAIGRLGIVGNGLEVEVLRLVTAATTDETVAYVIGHATSVTGVLNEFANRINTKPNL